MKINSAMDIRCIYEMFGKVRNWKIKRNQVKNVKK